MELETLTDDGGVTGATGRGVAAVVPDEAGTVCTAGAVAGLVPAIAPCRKLDAGLTV